VISEYTTESESTVVEVLSPGGEKQAVGWSDKSRRVRLTGLGTSSTGTGEHGVPVRTAVSHFLTPSVYERSQWNVCTDIGFNAIVF